MIYISFFVYISSRLEHRGGGGLRPGSRDAKGFDHYDISYEAYKKNAYCQASTGRYLTLIQGPR